MLRGFISALSIAGGLSLNSVIHSEGEENIHPGHYHWSHYGAFSSFDYAGIRRGYQVYRQVCAVCHSMDYIHFRNLVGVTHTEADAKKLAESYDVEDGPDDTGEMFERPGKLADRFPAPYQNEEQGRMANNGAYPPDLSLMVKARHDGANYVFSLLTGYTDAPAGKQMLPGLYYNPYFPGGAIAMPPPLDGVELEYEDGTLATPSQMAKDVTEFLAWAAEPEHDERKLMGLKFLGAVTIGLVLVGFYKKFLWSSLKTRKIWYTAKFGKK
jgi:ubiquinol-cytochrome c reductase cytochrome c1 subunit